MRKYRWLRPAATFLGALLITGATVITVTFPAAAAAVCPSCFGFRLVAPGIYVEKGHTDDGATALVAAVHEGRRRVRRFWGGREAAPRILLCISEDCFKRMNGGRRRGMSLLDFVAVLSPRGLNPVIAAHELSMTELYHRIGWLGFVRQAVPVWFNEGISMLASDDLRYLAPAGAGDRCLAPVPSLKELPAGPFEWNRRAVADKQLYAKAACATSRWIDAHGGPSAAVDLVSRIAAGSSFDEAVQ
jgi:hypothetical protein